VSSGVGDAGGVSYGSYQMTSKGGGTVAMFVADPTFRWKGDFVGLVPGTADFSAKWKAIAAAEPDAFRDAQHAYIKRTLFDPLVARTKAAGGPDVTARSDALQDVFWSTAVQHGPNTPVVDRALAAVKAGGVLVGNPAFDQALIKAIYAERGRKNDVGVLVYFSRNSPEIQNGVAKRFENEERDALAMLPRA
jgi:hypothetical protein